MAPPHPPPVTDQDTPRPRLSRCTLETTIPTSFRWRPPRIRSPRRVRYLLYYTTSISGNAGLPHKYHVPPNVRPWIPSQLIVGGLEALGARVGGRNLRRGRYGAPAALPSRLNLRSREDRSTLRGVSHKGSGTDFLMSSSTPKGTMGRVCLRLPRMFTDFIIVSLAALRSSKTRATGAAIRWGVMDKLCEDHGGWQQIVHPIPLSGENQSPYGRRSSARISST